MTAPGAPRLLLLGAPGAGKGTQGRRLAERYAVRHISTGDRLRAEVAEGSDLGRQAAPFMQRGDLVPDELILSMVLRDLVDESADGYVLDGFPRTVAQAEAAYAEASKVGRTLDVVVFLEVGAEQLVERIAARGLVSGRDDDNEETVRHRVEEYEQKTLPLLEYYDGRDILVRIDATAPIDAVTDEIFEAVDAMRARR